jgi:hypothetical protein
MELFKIASSGLFDFSANIHWQSYATAAFLFLSYNVFNTILQYRYYYLKRHESESWKVATSKKNSLEHSSSWWIPILTYWSSKERGPFHAIFATCNLLMSCIVGGFVTEV